MSWFCIKLLILCSIGIQCLYHSLLPSTFRISRQTALRAHLIVGINKYSHDAAISIIDRETRQILFTQSKERITGKKHDGGGVASLIEYGLKSIGAAIEDVKTVVSNNHHHRVLPYEKRLPFYKDMNYINDESNCDPLNLLPNAKHYELSHHLAHAWSVVSTSPFQNGLILVMDGMGESYKAMIEDIRQIEENSGDYMHDLKLIRGYGTENFVGQPMSLNPGSGYREAESAYIFDHCTATLKPIFKRWSRERSPSELFNHGFENMESIGAVYSRISSQILGDWNACGKVMGLAPWFNRKAKDAKDWHFYHSSSENSYKQVNLGENFYHKVNTMSGNPYEDGSFQINWQVLDSLQHTNQFSDELFGYYANLAASVQTDLETTSFSLIESLQQVTGQRNLALVGGVALNSVLNGKILKETDRFQFDKVYIPPCPGDEGVAVGCALYGLQRVLEEEKFAENDKKKEDLNRLEIPNDIFNFPRTKVNEMLSMDDDPVPETSSQVVPFSSVELSAYQSKEFTSDEIYEAIMDYAPYLDILQQFETDADLVTEAAAMMASASNTDKEPVIIGWFQGKSEFGQRALGARSILTDPRHPRARIVMNQKVKQREWYRPLAPSILDEYVSEYFEDLPSLENCSPFMSVTGTIRLEKAADIPAVCHIDRSARLQTVSLTDKSQESTLYAQLIEAFRQVTDGCPLILNTSFNRASQPIVETPSDAIKTFMECDGYMNYLYIGRFKLGLKSFPFLDDNTITGEEGNVYIFSNGPLYLTKVTSSMSPNGLKTSKIEIQNGGMGDSEMKWLELPSELHLEIMQLLQVEVDENASQDVSAAGSYAVNDLTVLDIFNALSEIRTDRDEGSLSWMETREALKWLYVEGLIYFDDPRLEMDPKQLFKDATEIIDLRK